METGLELRKGKHWTELDCQCSWPSQCAVSTTAILNTVKDFTCHYYGILPPVNSIILEYRHLFSEHTVSSIGRVTEKKLRPVSATSDEVTSCMNRDTCNSERSIVQHTVVIGWLLCNSAYGSDLAL
jgi:hypothetical protein